MKDDDKSKKHAADAGRKRPTPSAAVGSLWLLPNVVGRKRPSLWLLPNVVERKRPTLHVVRPTPCVVVVRPTLMQRGDDERRTRRRNVLGVLREPIRSDVSARSRNWHG
jgi:hypothetical protein